MSRPPPFIHRRAGYSLIELLAVLAILGVLASMALPVAETLRQREREVELKRALWEIRGALDRWRDAVQAGALRMPPGLPPYPPDLASLIQAWRDERPEHRGEVLRFLRKVPRDPFADPLLPAEQTWGLRSYLSEADEPRPGSEVYDVYSRSERTATDGSLLRNW